MYRLSCNSCDAEAFVDCRCSELGVDTAVSGAHHPHCLMAGGPDGRDISDLVVCDCCEASHPGLSHDQHANTCDSSHSGAHGVGNAACPVCRPITITALPGSALVQAVTGG